MPTHKEILLISYLINQSGWVTASCLANNLDVSPRSISNYISDINLKYENVILSSNKGYKIQKEKGFEILNSIPSRRIPSNYEDRKKYILNKIMLSHQVITMDFLADKLCISPLTLQNEISKLRNELSKDGLHLRIKNDRLSIIGQDRDKRRLIYRLINDELESSSFSIDAIQDLFISVDLKKIRNIVLTALKKYEYFLDDYSLLNYIIHIAVLLEVKIRTDGANQPEQPVFAIDHASASPHIEQIIEEIYQELSICTDADFTFDEMFEISLLMMTRAVPSHINKVKIDQLGNLVSPEIEELLYEIVNSVRNEYAIDLKQDSFMSGFAMHLKNVVARAKNNLVIRNNQFRKIKRDFPFIYVIAVFISNIIKKRTGYSISEDEIAYIALHIGVLMEEKKAHSEKLKCVLLAPDFTGSKKLYKKVTTVFTDSLLVTNILTSYDDLSNTGNYDLLLSTIEINPVSGISYLLLDPFLSENSIKRIFQRIDEIKQIKIKEKMINQFKFFFRSDLFFYDRPFKTHEDAIEAICDTMMQKNYVDQNYKREIYEHEDVAPSSYSNISIPHPLSNSAISSVIAVSINPTPIQWGVNEVNIVFMLSLQEENRDLFKDIFNSITQLMSNEEFHARIMNARNYDDFIDVLVSYS